MVQFRGGFLVVVVVVVIVVVVVVVVVVVALNLKAQVLWVDLGVSDASLGSKCAFFVCISANLAMSRRKNTRHVRGEIGSRGFLSCFGWVKKGGVNEGA